MVVSSRSSAVLGGDEGWPGGGKCKVCSRGGAPGAMTNARVRFCSGGSLNGCAAVASRLVSGRWYDTVVTTVVAPAEPCAGGETATPSPAVGFGSDSSQDRPAAKQTKTSKAAPPTIPTLLAT